MRVLRPRVAASLVLAALVLSVRPLAASTGSARSGPSIVGGDPAAAGRFPFAVSLQRAGASGAAAHFCGGSLVGPTWVLTAAHCVEGLTPAAVRVVIGATRLSAGDGEVRRAAEIRVDPAYDGDAAHGGDAALIRLTVAVRDVAPLALVGSSERVRWEPGDVATVVGWGVTTEAGAVAVDGLRSVRVPIEPDAVMARPDVYGDSFRASDMVGAGSLEGGADACFGDSGGPLVVGRGSTVRQVGIVSFGEGCGRPGHPGVYSRVGEGPVRRFVDSVLGPSTPG